MPLTGKVIVITGATSGIGKAAALSLAKKGATLILPVRNLEKGALLKQSLFVLSANKNIELIKCDLSSLMEVKETSEYIKNKYPVIDILINNAGIWMPKRMLSTDHIEMTFAVNHLAPFLMTNILMNQIKNSSDGKIINLSSAAHHIGKIDFSDIELKDKYNLIKAYARSKTANILFTNKLAEILQDSKVSVFAIHPGGVNTHLFDRMNSFLKYATQLFLKSPEKGAETIIYLATLDKVKMFSGKYFANNKIQKISKFAQNTSHAEKLWELSLSYTKKFLS